MDIYDDYANYIKEMDPFLKELESSSSPILVVLQDVLTVTNYVYKHFLEKSKIDSDLEETFDIGYGYLSNIVSDLKLYYKQYFHNDIELMNSFSKLILYHFYIDDFKWHLDEIEHLTKERRQVIDKIEDKIDDILANQKPFDLSLIESFDEQVQEITPLRDSFQPVYSIFSMIAEELNIF